VTASVRRPKGEGAGAETARPPSASAIAVDCISSVLQIPVTFHNTSYDGHVHQMNIEALPAAKCISSAPLQSNDLTHDP